MFLDAIQYSLCSAALTLFFTPATTTTAFIAFDFLLYSVLKSPSEF